MTKVTKRVDAGDSASVLVRAKDGSAFAKCDECKKNVPVALISMHDCSLEAKIKMNLDSHVVEQAAAEAKKPERKKPSTKEPAAKKAKGGKDKKEKKVKDPNMPKRPATAFFVFMDDFRKTFKEANPDSKDVKRVAKEGGEKWKSLTDEEKKPYLDRVAELKAEYEKAMEAYNAGEKEDQEASDKSDKEAPAAEEVEELTDEE